MSPVAVSTAEVVLEHLRQHLVTNLGESYAIPDEAKKSGGCHDAVTAWVRLQHRAVSPAPRRVQRSPELRNRLVHSSILRQLAVVQSELERGDDMTQRLSRQFFKAGFNDFLFNKFKIQHLHLGPRDTDLDKTKRHKMAGGGNLLVFVLISASEAYFLNVFSHDAFHDVNLAKALVRIALRNRRDMMSAYIAPPGTEALQSFEAAFELGKGGINGMFKLDKVSFLPGATVLDKPGNPKTGERPACTSVEVLTAANKIMNLTCQTVDLFHKEAETMADHVEVKTGSRPTTFSPVVVSANTSQVVLYDKDTSIRFDSDGVWARQTSTSIATEAVVS